jgi:hypothetical protein
MPSNIIMSERHHEMWDNSLKKGKPNLRHYYWHKYYESKAKSTISSNSVKIAVSRQNAQLLTNRLKRSMKGR